MFHMQGDPSMCDVLWMDVQLSVPSADTSWWTVKIPRCPSRKSRRAIADTINKLQILALAVEFPESCSFTNVLVERSQSGLSTQASTPLETVDKERLAW